jgi:hypothetical protein
MLIVNIIESRGLWNHDSNTRTVLANRWEENWIDDWKFGLALHCALNCYEIK